MLNRNNFHDNVLIVALEYIFTAVNMRLTDAQALKMIRIFLERTINCSKPAKEAIFGLIRKSYKADPTDQRLLDPLTRGLNQLKLDELESDQDIRELAKNAYNNLMANVLSRNRIKLPVKGPSKLSALISKLKHSSQ